jgi:thiamine-phosphate pyrophosphorylase
MPLTFPIVYLITDGSASDQTFETDRTQLLSTIGTAVAAGVSLIQIREKELSASRLSRLVADAALLTRGSSTRLLVNDRADIALASGADGVHLPADSLPAGAVRKNFPADFIIGVSAHDQNEVEAAAADGADLSVFGPVFDTPGKGPAKGLELLSQACKKVWPFPVLALGGIDVANWRATIDAGAAGFAAIRSLNNAASFREIMDAVKDEFRDQK